MAFNALHTTINNPHQLLYRKYNNLIGIYNRMHVDILVYSLKSHYFTVYKDHLLWNYIEDFFKGYYTTQECVIQIPKIAIYYKNYSLFFCRPFLKNFYYSLLLQRHSDNKAEAFYKQAYGSLKNSTKAIRNTNSFIANEGVNVGNDVNDRHTEIKGEENNEMKTIFNTSVRNAIDNNLMTTIDCIITQSDNKEVLVLGPNNEEFFTIGAHNDFLIDLLNNFTYKENNNNENGLKMVINNHHFCKNAKPVFLSGIDNHSINRKKRVDIKKPIHHIKIYKSSYCNLYNQKALSIKLKPKCSNKKSTITSPSNSTMQLFSLKYNSPSRFSEFNKHKLQYNIKSKKNSLVSNSNSVTSDNKQENISYYNKKYFRSIKKAGNNLSIQLKSNSNNKKSYNTQANITKVKLKKKQCNKTKSPQRIIKKIQSSVITPDLLSHYLHNASHCTNKSNRHQNNRKQSKSKWENYFSVRSNSDEEQTPSEVKPKLKPKSNYPNQIFRNKEGMNTVQNTKISINKDSKDTKEEYNNQNAQKNFEHLITKINLPHNPQNNKREANTRMMNQELNIFQTSTNVKASNNFTNLKYTTPTSPNLNDNCLRNKSHLKNDKTKHSHNKIKMNLSSNRIVSELFIKKTCKSINNDSSTQTTTNTNQGNGITKSPKMINKKKGKKISEINTNNSNNISKVIRSEKQSRRSSPGNLVSVFFSQRK